jgi:hypothetical protein
VSAVDTFPKKLVFAPGTKATLDVPTCVLPAAPVETSVPGATVTRTE